MDETLNPQSVEVGSSEDQAVAEPSSLKEQVILVLKGCYDPEIPVDIYDLGLVYEIETTEPHSVDVKMTLTSPSCPVADSLPLEVESKIRAVPGVEQVSVEVVWDPPWTMENMSEAANLQLGLL